MKKKLISVIVPVYNVENYLDDCLSSLSSQSYDNIEIILVNDGSTDNSLSICNKWTKSDFRMKLISQENLGLSAARNTGIDAAHGDYICFVDSDDIVHQDYLSKLYVAIESTVSDISIAKFVRFSEKSDINLQQDVPDHWALFINSKENRPLFLNREIANTEVWNKLYRASLIFELPSPVFPVGKIHEDEYFTPKAFRLAEKAVLVDSELYFYRTRANSITSSFSYRDLDGLDFMFSRLHDIHDNYPRFYVSEALKILNILPAYIRMINKSLTDREKSLAVSRIRQHIKDLPNKKNIFLKASLTGKIKILYLSVKFLKN